MVNKIYFLKIINLYTEEECANFTSANVETYEYITCESIENTYTGIGENLKPFVYLITTISVELGFLWDFEVLKLKTCSLYHENIFNSMFGSSHSASFACQKVGLRF